MVKININDIKEMNIKRPLGIVISAFPCCGKSYFTENFQGKPFTSTDSDSSQFSWITRKITEEELNALQERWESVPRMLPFPRYKYENDTRIVRNPNFIPEYIAHIKECREKYDIVFVSSHLEVRKALEDNNIPFATIYPIYNSDSVKNEWIGRMFSRGSSIEFIKDQADHWDERTKSILGDEPKGFLTLLGNARYINNELIFQIIQDMIQTQILKASIL